MQITCTHRLYPRLVGHGACKASAFEDWCCIAGCQVVDRSNPVIREIWFTIWHEKTCAVERLIGDEDTLDLIFFTIDFTVPAPSKIGNTRKIQPVKARRKSFFAFYWNHPKVVHWIILVVSCAVLLIIAIYTITKYQWWLIFSLTIVGGWIWLMFKLDSWKK